MENSRLMNAENIDHNIDIKQKRVLKAFVLIFIGIAIRIIMLFYYYYVHMIDSGRDWGDTGNYFTSNITNPPLSIFLLELMRFLSFGYIEIFVFWSFLLDLISCLIFYFVLKSFKIKEKNYIYGLFLINPLFFLTNSFSIENCGYHITDSFFLCLLFLALIFYPKENLNSTYIFYFFLGLSICAKYYTFPTLGFFFIKYLYDKNWKEMKILFIVVFPLISILLIIPFFLWEEFASSVLSYPTEGYGLDFPLYIKIIPILVIFVLYCLFRIKKSDGIEILTISIITFGILIFFSYPYLRWFQIIITYGILKEKTFFELNLNLKFIKKKILINNHLLTFYLSFIGVFVAYIFILYVH